MADHDQLECLKRSVKEWNSWREDKPHESVDLREANLHEAKIAQVNLSGANLSRAKLLGAKLQEANLSRANLTGAYLHGAKLKSAYLQGANLTGAHLSNVDLSNATLREANLTRADLSEAQLNRAHLNLAYLNQANLSRTNLSRADLSGATLVRARCDVDTSVFSANLEFAVIVDTDVSSFVSVIPDQRTGLAVDWKSVARARYVPRLVEFLEGTGMPLTVATYLVDSVRTISEGVLFTMLQSVFISYGGPDEQFAAKLNDALFRNGVSTWFFPESPQYGQPIRREVRKGITDYERVILICSASSLSRPGVLFEIETALKREANEGGQSILIPIRLDDYLFDADWASDRPDLKQEICERVVADFRGTKDDDAEFTKQLSRLLLALGKKPAGIK